MTFDDAKGEIDSLVETKWQQDLLDKAFSELREEYAPTVEMTMDQYTLLTEHRNNAVKRVDKVGILEFMSAYSEMMTDFNHLTLMHAWLHPELVKVVN